MIPTLGVEGNDYIVYCDASHLGLVVLLMHDINDITYSSSQLNVYERKYPTHDLELTVIVFTLKI